MYSLEQAKKDMIQVGRELYDKGLMVGIDGNISIRLSENEILITASGVCKGKLEMEQVTLVDLEGNIVNGPKPARDLRMHLAIYKERPDAKAIVHSHPPIATGYAMSDVDLHKVALPEVLFNLGGIVITEYTTPTTIEVPRELTRILKDNKVCQAILIANHGTITFGENVFDASYKLESLEMFAKASLVSKIVGNTRYLNDEQLSKVNRLLKGEHPDSVVNPNE